MNKIHLYYDAYFKDYNIKDIKVFEENDDINEIVIFEFVIKVTDIKIVLEIQDKKYYAAILEIDGKFYHLYEKFHIHTNLIYDNHNREYYEIIIRSASNIKYKKSEIAKVFKFRKIDV